MCAGLYLPTSDIDAVLLHSGCRDPRQGLKALANALHRRDMATNVQVIAKAKVPIVKFIERESGFQFDVSFDVANGPAVRAPPLHRVSAACPLPAAWSWRRAYDRTVLVRRRSRVLGGLDWVGNPECWPQRAHRHMPRQRKS